MSHPDSRQQRQHVAAWQILYKIKILKCLRHCHVVKFVGSYTDLKYIGLIIPPVAKKDLATYLLHISISKYRKLQTFFGCLAKALKFLHQQNIHYKDIKPGNILVHCGNVLFADFGLSFNFTDATRSITISMINRMAPRYCTPKVALLEPQNTLSNVWSLGVVFLEMITVLKGKLSKYIDEFFRTHGSQQAYICTNPVAFAELVKELQGTGNLHDCMALTWIQPMLYQEPQCHLTVAELVAEITASDKESGDSTTFCGICCVLLDDGFSDSIDECKVAA
jgi:serine/threonine protein kinase